MNPKTIIFGVLILFLHGCSTKEHQTELHIKAFDQVENIWHRVKQLKTGHQIGESALFVVGDYLVLQDVQNRFESLHIIDKHRGTYCSPIGTVGRSQRTCSKRIVRCTPSIARQSLLGIRFSKEIVVPLPHRLCLGRPQLSTKHTPQTKGGINNEEDSTHQRFFVYGNGNE